MKHVNAGTAKQSVLYQEIARLTGRAGFIRFAHSQ
jgi:hypothetical protein